MSVRELHKKEIHLNHNWKWKSKKKWENLRVKIVESLKWQNTRTCKK